MSLRKTEPSVVWTNTRRTRPLLSGSTSTTIAIGPFPREIAASINKTKLPTSKLARYQTIYAFLKEAANTCRGQNNGIFRIKLNLGTKARHLTPILGENFFFSDHLILETKFNKKALKVPRVLKYFKNVPQSEKG